MALYICDDASPRNIRLSTSLPAHCCAVLLELEAITSFARDMSAALNESERTERRAFVESFVVSPGQVKVRYTIPMPQYRRIAGMDAEEVSIFRPLLSTVDGGSAYGIRTRDLRLERAVSLAARRTRHAVGRNGRWLGIEDSNLGLQIQNLSSYH